MTVFLAGIGFGWNIHQFRQREVFQSFDRGGLDNMDTAPTLLDGVVTPERAARAIPGMTAEAALAIDQALVAAGRVDEAETWAKAFLAVEPSSRDLLMALLRRLVRAGRAEEGFALLARGIDSAPLDATLLIVAARALNPSPAAEPALAALRRAGDAAPTELRIQEAVIRALLAVGRADEAQAGLTAIVSAAAHRFAYALLVADVQAAAGNLDAALDALEHARAIAKPAELSRLDQPLRRAALWTHRRDLVRVQSEGSAGDWNEIAERITAEGLPATTWDEVIAAARAAGALKRLAPALSRALDRDDLRGRLEPVFREASADDPGRIADRLAGLPLDDRKILEIDQLLVDAGRLADADAHARAHLAVNPTFLRLARRLAERLDANFRHDEIDRICAAALAVTPADAGWALLWAGYLVKTLRCKDAIRVCRAAIAAGSEHVGLRYALATHILREGDPEEALRVQREAAAQFAPSADLMELAAEALAALGRRDEMRSAIEESRRLAEAMIDGSLREKQHFDRVTTRLDWLQAQLDSGEIIARVPVAQPTRGLVAILSQRSPFILMWSLLAACEMRRRGYETVFLDAPAVSIARPDDPELAALDGLVDPTGRRLVGEPPAETSHPDWVIDPAARSIERQGYDLHQPVVERIATVQRRYRVVPGIQADAVREDAMLRADVAITVCDRLADLVSRRLAASGSVGGRQPRFEVRIFSLMTHYAPACIYKQFCARVAPELPIEYVEFNVGYEQYKSNRTDEAARSVSVANLTRNADQRISIHTTERAFADWLARNADVAKAAAAEAEGILALDRSKREHSPEAAAVHDRILAHRAGGGRVVCLLGKITYDIAIEQEGGPAHVDMVDWLNHSIDCVRGHDDVLLLIKPHPYEIVPEIADPTERFTDLIEVAVPANCVVLEHRWFNLAELMPLVDLVSIWHGTATLEVLAQGVPLVVGATWGIKDHPISVIAPHDRDDYRAILVSHEPRTVGDDVRRRARMLIAHLVSEDVIVPYPYGNLFGLRAAASRRWGWNHEAVERWFAEGDPHTAYLADLAEWGGRRPS